MSTVPSPERCHLMGIHTCSKTECDLASVEGDKGNSHPTALFFDRWEAACHPDSRFTTPSCTSGTISSLPNVHVEGQKHLFMLASCRGRPFPCYQPKSLRSLLAACSYTASCYSFDLPPHETPITIAEKLKLFPFSF